MKRTGAWLIGLMLLTPLVGAFSFLQPSKSSAAACGGFTVHGGTYPAQRVRSIVHHYASCREVHAMVGRWALRAYRNTGPAMYGPWTCSFDSLYGRPARRSGQERAASCTAGLNGYVQLRLTAE